MHAVSNSQLADWSNLSLGHLSRLFRSNFASGPQGVIETARLVSSAINLQRTDLPLRIVASAAGYTNEYHFSRRFVNFYQMPPARFRREVKAVDPVSPIKNEALLGAINLLLAGTLESGVAFVAQNSLK